MRLVQVQTSAPQVGPAAFDLNADSQAAVAADWTPGSGESVRLLTMGGSSGQVLSGPDAKGKLAVKVCSHVLQLHHPLQSALKPTSSQHSTQQWRSSSAVNIDWQCQS